MITIYTMPDCVQCEQTKRYLTLKNVEYSVVDISKDEEAYAKVTSLGYKAAPVVITEYDSWSGFRLEKLANLAKSA